MKPIILIGEINSEGHIQTKESISSLRKLIEADKVVIIKDVFDECLLDSIKNVVFDFGFSSTKAELPANTGAKKEASEILVTPADIFDDITLFGVNEVPQIMEKGHMLYFNSFMSRLESLFKMMTNSNMDLDLEEFEMIGRNASGGGVSDPNPTATKKK